MVSKDCKGLVVLIRLVRGITAALRDEPWTRRSSSTPSFSSANDFESRRRPRDPTPLSLSLSLNVGRGIGG